VFLQNATFPNLHSLVGAMQVVYICPSLSYINAGFFIIVKLVLLLIMHNAFAPGREAANQQSIENLTTTHQPLQET
jgi:hypothetical protein